MPYKAFVLLGDKAHALQGIYNMPYWVIRRMPYKAYMPYWVVTVVPQAEKSPAPVRRKRFGQTVCNTKIVPVEYPP